MARKEMDFPDKALEIRDELRNFYSRLEQEVDFSDSIDVCIELIEEMRDEMENVVGSRLEDVRGAYWSMLADRIIWVEKMLRDLGKKCDRFFGELESDIGLVLEDTDKMYSELEKALNLRR